jgi:hypothetical protein
VAATIIDDAPSPTREHHQSRVRLMFAASLLAFGVAAASAASTATRPQTVLEVGAGAATSGPDAAAAPAIADPGAAIESWLGDHRDQLFRGAPSTYVGTCESATTDGLCSTETEDLGDAQVHTVGVTATDWGADVLVERNAADGSWQVTGVEAWPALGDRYDGPRWSPTTAITTWWTDDAKAETMYGAGAVHLRSCDEAAAATAGTGQPLLCSALVEDTGATRVYDSGQVGRPADVRITVAAQPDRTWTVTETLAR